MNDKQNYISDEMLEQLILQVEQNELVTAPPDLTEKILQAAGLGKETSMELLEPEKNDAFRMASAKSKATRKKEFYAYCFRVITSVAAAVALVFLLPELSVSGQRTDQMPERYKQEVPGVEEVVDEVPSREKVILSGETPTREEVLSDTGFFDRVLDASGWFRKENNKN